MLLDRDLHASLEDGLLQSSTAFFNALTLALTPLMGRSDMTDAMLYEAKLDRIIEKYIGFRPSLAVDDNLNAWMQTPVFDLNNPLLVSVRDTLRSFNYTDATDVLREYLKDVGLLNTKIEGQIDRKTGMVTGSLKKLPFKMCIGKPLFTTEFRQGRMLPEEIAAIILHEVGHAYTLLRSIVTTTQVNATLAASWQALTTEEDATVRLKIVDATAKQLGANKVDVQCLSQTTSPDNYVLVMISGMIDDREHSSAGSVAYDYRSSEVSADQYAARLGAARPLATGLLKLGIGSGLRDNLIAGGAAFGFIFIYGALITQALLGGVILAGLFAIVLLIGSLFDSSRNKLVYDPPAQRIGRLAQDLVQQLKAPMSKTQQKMLLEELAALREISAALGKNQSLYDRFWSLLTASRRDQNAQRKFQEELESLVNNELYVHSARLKSLFA